MQVAVMDFGGVILRLQVRRRAGMEGKDVLELEESESHPHNALGDGSIWSRAMNMFAGDSKAPVAGRSQVCALRNTVCCCRWEISPIL